MSLSGPILRLSIIQENNRKVRRVFLQTFFKAKRYGRASDNVKNALNTGHNMYKHMEHLAISTEIISGLISNNIAIMPAGPMPINGTIVIHFASLITFFVSEKVSEVYRDIDSIPDIILIQNATLL
jgi:hypothetical protein